jgi:hypothetical protein
MLTMSLAQLLLKWILKNKNKNKNKKRLLYFLKIELIFLS